jgi:hypothetical protein
MIREAAERLRLEDAHPPPHGIYGTE